MNTAAKLFIALICAVALWQFGGLFIRRTPARPYNDTSGRRWLTAIVIVVALAVLYGFAVKN